MSFLSQSVFCHFCRRAIPLQASLGQGPTKLHVWQVGQVAVALVGQVAVAGVASAPRLFYLAISFVFILLGDFTYPFGFFNTPLNIFSDPPDTSAQYHLNSFLNSLRNSSVDSFASPSDLLNLLVADRVFSHMCCILFFVDCLVSQEFSFRLAHSRNYIPFAM